MSHRLSYKKKARDEEDPSRGPSDRSRDHGGSRRYDRKPYERRRSRSRSRSPQRNSYRTDSRYDRRDDRPPRRENRNDTEQEPIAGKSKQTDTQRGSESTSQPSAAPKMTSLSMIEVIANDRLGGKVRVKCSPDDTVGDLKKLIAAQNGTKPEKIVLKKWYTIYKDHIKLSDYEIHNGMSLEMN